MENTDPLPTKPTALDEFADRFLAWEVSGRVEEMTKRFYRNGWRLLKATSVAHMRVDQITGDCAEQLKFPGSAQLRVANITTHASQSGRVEDDRSRSENQDDEGARAASSA